MYTIYIYIYTNFECLLHECQILCHICILYTIFCFLVVNILTIVQACQ